MTHEEIVALYDAVLSKDDDESLDIFDALCWYFDGYIDADELTRWIAWIRS